MYIFIDNSNRYYLENRMVTRNTKQKTEIKNFLMTRKDHPTAETVYFALKEIMPKISLGTVYRVLNSMVESGEIFSFRLEDNVVRYDARTDDHYHFICRDCGSVSDIMGVTDKITVDSDDFNGRLEGHTVYFYGKCSHCMT